jgi:vacuolar-type H+-ATPase subunit E/Vma4
MGQDNQRSGNGVGPLASLANTRTKLQARQIADLERRKAALLARREIIDHDIKEVEEKLDELRERSE